MKIIFIFCIRQVFFSILSRQIYLFMQHYRGTYVQNSPWSSCLLLLLLQYIFLFAAMLLASVSKDKASACVNCKRMANYACLSHSQVAMGKAWFFYLKSNLLVVSWLWPDTSYPQKPLTHSPLQLHREKI